MVGGRFCCGVSFPCTHSKWQLCTTSNGPQSTVGVLEGRYGTVRYGTARHSMVLVRYGTRMVRVGV